MSEPTLRPRLLIVEPDDSLRRVLTRALNRRFEVTPVRSGAAALGRLREERFDVLLVDLGLRDVLLAARPVGAFVCVPKPYDTATLDAALERALAR